jgi:hypothetical protein
MRGLLIVVVTGLLALPTLSARGTDGTARIHSKGTDAQPSVGPGRRPGAAAGGRVRERFAEGLATRERLAAVL